MEDVAWAAPLSDKLFTHLDVGYGAAVTRWAASPAVWGFVAEDAAGPGAFILLGTFGLLGEGQTRLLEILALAVHPACRRRGFGRSLLARALQEARQDPGVRHVRLNVAADNMPARALFAMAGFSIDREDDGTFARGQRAIRLAWRPRPRVATNL